VRELLRVFQGEEWSARRNKSKDLRDALRDGPEEVVKFLKVYRLDALPGLGYQPDPDEDFSKKGWGKGDPSYCGYFDALELMDSFIPLDPSTPRTPEGKGSAAPVEDANDV
jgi:hypothetical protein